MSMENEKFWNEQEKILKKMVAVLTKNYHKIDLYSCYHRAGGRLTYPEWYSCLPNKIIQENAIRFGYKGELLDESIMHC